MGKEPGQPKNTQNHDFQKDAENVEIEQEEKLRLLSRINKGLESEIERMGNNYITSLKNIGYDLKGFWPYLSKRIYEEAVPAAGISAVKLAMAKLDNMEEDIENLDEACEIFGHEVRHVLPSNDKTHYSEVFYSALMRFIADEATAVADRDYSFYMYDRLGDKKKAEESKKKVEKAWKEIKEIEKHNSVDVDSVFLYLENHKDEVSREIHEAYAEFIERIKETPEYQVDLGQVLLEVKQEVENEIAKLIH